MPQTCLNITSSKLLACVKHIILLLHCVLSLYLKWEGYKKPQNCKEQIFTSKRYSIVFFFVDCRWKVVLCAERGNVRTQGLPQYILTEKDKNRFLKALYDKCNPKCLQYYLLESEKLAVANLKQHHVEFTSDGYLKIIFEIERRYFELLQGCDVETCIYQFLKENGCRNLLLCSEKGYGE